MPRCGTIDPKTVDEHDFYYKCSKDGPALLFGSLRIKDKTDEPLSPVKTNTIPNKWYTKKRF